MRWILFGCALLAVDAYGVDFDSDVAPILTRRCLACHNNKLDNAGVSFENRETVLPRASELIAAIRYKGDIKMPPGAKLPGAEAAVLTAWIGQGLPWGEKLRGHAVVAQQYPFELWTFDRLENIAGYPTKVEGHPHVIDSPVGKAVEFNGVDDALFIEDHPLAGAETFTWEVIFRPDKKGNAAQRFFHLQERDTENRLLFEIRVMGDDWILDTFAMSPTGSKTLLNSGHAHPLGEWYHVAQVYDGREYRNYINGVLENAGPLTFTANREGSASVGVRINRRDYFKGAIARARFTRGGFGAWGIYEVALGGSDQDAGDVVGASGLAGGFNQKAALLF